MRFLLRHVVGDLTPREAGGVLLAIAAGFVAGALLLGLSVQLTGVDMRAPPPWATTASFVLVVALCTASAWYVIGAFATMGRRRSFGRDELVIAIALAGFAAAWSGRAAFMIADGEPVLDAFGLTAARGVWAVRVDGETLRIAGDITPGLAQRISDEIDEHPEVSALSINSPGGRLDAARRIAMLVDASALNVEVPAYCASACLTVLAAGRRRIVSDNAAIGCHQPSDMITGESVGEFGAFPPIYPPPSDRETYRRVVSVCNQTPPEDIYYIPIDDLRAIGAVTDVGRGLLSP